MPNFISFATSIAELAHGEKLHTYSSSLSAAREQKHLRIRNISDVNLDAVGVEVSSIIADDDGRFAAELSAVFTAHLYRYNMLYYLSTMRTCNHALSPSKYQISEHIVITESAPNFLALWLLQLCQKSGDGFNTQFLYGHRINPQCAVKAKETGTSQNHGHHEHMTSALHFCNGAWKMPTSAYN